MDETHFVAIVVRGILDFIFCSTEKKDKEKITHWIIVMGKNNGNYLG
jgi:hypothetical protein